MIADASTPDTATKAALSKEAGYYEKIIAAAHNNIGLLRAERQDFHIAAEQFRIAKKWDPELQGADLNLGLASYKAEEYREAVAPLEAELKAHPENSSGRAALLPRHFPDVL